MGNLFSGRLKYLIPSTLVAMILLLALSYYLSLGGKLPSFKKAQKTASPPPQNTIKVSPIFDSQRATIRGSVSQIKHNSILVIKNRANSTDQFPAAPNLQIYKYKVGSTEATASSDLKSIELDKEALIVLEAIKGEYKVVSISYLATQPTQKQ